MSIYAAKDETIEGKYGVEQGDDWLEVRFAASFKAGQRVTFSQPGAKVKQGVVIDIRRRSHGLMRGSYEYLVQYDGQNIPRWTLEKWLTAGYEAPAPLQSADSVGDKKMKIIGLTSQSKRDFGTTIEIPYGRKGGAIEVYQSNSPLARDIVCVDDSRSAMVSVDRGTALELIKVLQRFVNTGSIVEVEETPALLLSAPIKAENEDTA